MPKATEGPTSHNYYRISPLSVASDITSPRQYPSIAATMQSTQHMSSGNLSPYANGGPVQPLQYHHSQQMSQSAPVSVRPSSGAWTPQDDAQLMSARSQGLNWTPIQVQYFPNKTPNACRKRHERLMDRRNSDDWDVIKLETMAKEYMGMRREIWTQLGNKTGEKWNVVEAKCMQSGLKNLQSAARACARRERLENPHQSTQHSVHHHAHHTHLSASSTSSGSGSSLLPVQHHYSTGGGGADDSGIVLDDLEAEYQSNGGGDTASYGGQSAASLSPDERDTGSRTGPMKLYPAPVGGGSGGYDVRRSADGYAVGGGGGQMMGGGGRERGGGIDGRGYGGGGPGTQHQRPAYGMRLPSIDMGIGAIINRGPGSM